MSRLQQEMVVRGEDVTVTSVWFMGKPVATSPKFAYSVPIKFFKRKNKRLIKKWSKRYGVSITPRTDAVILPLFILCHPNTLWRFDPKNFADDTSSSGVKHDIHV